MRKPLSRCLHLDLLQTCRQIYHEAALKPFAVNCFHYIASPMDSANRTPILNLFLAAMVPAQVRVIRHLRVVSDCAVFPCATAIRQLKGLVHIDVQLVLSDCALDFSCDRFVTDIWEHLRHFSDDDGINALAELHLKSAHVTVDVQSAHLLSTRLDTAAINAWRRLLELLEAKLTKSIAG
jgi:hypothetical protein